jgi:hypothetical protein
MNYFQKGYLSIAAFATVFNLSGILTSNWTYYFQSIVLTWLVTTIIVAYPRPLQVKTQVLISVILISLFVLSFVSYHNIAITKSCYLYGAYWSSVAIVTHFFEYLSVSKNTNSNNS